MMNLMTKKSYSLEFDVVGALWNFDLLSWLVLYPFSWYDHGVLFEKVG